MEAWVTSVLKDESEPSAVVLVNSLRRTGTTKKIAVIVSPCLSAKIQITLRKTFDCVFVIQQHEDSTGQGSLDAKIFAFSLCCFTKCVYISPGCMLLENADNLFAGKEILKLIKCVETGLIDWSVFSFTPNNHLWQHLLESCGNDKENLTGPLRAWLGKEKLWGKKTKYFSADILAKFSISNNILLTDKANVPIIQFVDADSDRQLLEQIKALQEASAFNTGMREKRIIALWLELSSKINKSPYPSPEKYTNEPVAIIGMSCRYPGASSLEEFWDMLRDGRGAAGEPPSFRWPKEHTNHVTEQERKTIAGFLKERVDEFDAKFFGVSPKDMTYLDPQVRLLHEIFWEALEDSSIDPLSLHGTHTGVFTGSWLSDYKQMLQETPDKDFLRTYMGVGMGAAAARLSFLLGLTGPSIFTESGCSSAMVALDLAVKSLRIGETNLAVVGGVNLLLNPFTTDIMEFVLSPNGLSKTFDVDADGFGRAEGCGVLVLKRLCDATRDGDKIWATIRGCAVAQEGPSRSFGTPTVHCEALAMSLALEDANVSPEEVSFVEAHGTGTSVGDPLEVNAIAKAYHSPNRERPLVIGSVKTNVGHTESCSGITGIMKVILSMQNQLIPKHLNFNTLNPEIFLNSIPAILPLEPVPWPKVEDHPRIAGVSSFGITGTDGHVIIEEAPNYQQPRFVLGMERTAHILKISGKTSDALKELVERYQNLFSERAVNEQSDSCEAFGNAAYSANVGRATFGHRAFLIAENYQEAAQILKSKGYYEQDLSGGEDRQICFLFTGQGSQYVGMAKTLYETSPIFRIHFDICDRKLKDKYNLSICDILCNTDASSEELNRTIYSQTSIFCVEYCLLKLWESWGIHPNYVLGHSLGEFCAAVAAGILTLEDALTLVVERSKLIDSLPRGSMLVVRKSECEVMKLLKKAKINLDIAAVNTLEQTVVSGDTETVHTFLEFLKAQQIKSVILGATHAFHSEHMNPMLDKYKQVADTITPKQGNINIQFVSGLEGRIISDNSHLDSNYWVQHTREPVRFIEACTTLNEIRCLNFLEVGPQPILSSFVAENCRGNPINFLPSLKRGTDDWRTILNSLGRLYLLGHSIDWKGFEAPYLREKVSLPFHPFHRKSFWMKCNENTEKTIHPLLGHSIKNASPTTIFRNQFNVESAPFISDHRLGELIVFPGAGYVEMCLSAGHYVASGVTERLDRMPIRAIGIENFRIEAPLEINEEASSHLQVIVDLSDNQTCDSGKGGEGFRIRIYHQNSCESASDKWVLHASANFVPVVGRQEAMKMWKPTQTADIISTETPSDATAFYKAANEQGLKFGESFKSIRRFWTKKQDLDEPEDEVVVEMGFPPDYSNYLIHPLFIDAVFQSVYLTRFKYGDTKFKVPVAIGRLIMLRGIEEIQRTDENLDLLYIHTWRENGRYLASISTGCNRTPIAVYDNIQLIETNVRAIASILEQQSSDIADAWQEIWKPIPGPFSSAVQVIDVEPVLTDDRLQTRMRAFRELGSEYREEYRDLDTLLYLYTLNAFHGLGWKPVIGEKLSVAMFCERLGIQPSFKKLVTLYFAVLRDQAKILQNDKQTQFWLVKNLPPKNSEIQRQVGALRDKLYDSGTAPFLDIYDNVSKHLASILTGEVSALALLFPTDEAKMHLSVDTLYRENPMVPVSNKIFEEICNSIFEKSISLNPPHSGKIYRVLEVGSGEGSLTTHLLTWLRNGWGDSFELYFTDLSPYFFVKAEEKFREFQANIKYTVFNIEESPLSQCIPLGYFDMVCAVDVLHATRNLEETLVHLRQTLRPGGLLCIRETVTQVWNFNFVFGLLEGYWRFQDYHWRPNHCCVGVDVWEQRLKQTGFETVHSFPAFMDKFAVITAVANPDFKMDKMMPQTLGDCTSTVKGEWIIFADGTNSCRAIVFQLTSILVVSGFNVSIVLSTENQMSVTDFYNGVLSNSVNLVSIQDQDDHSSEIQSILEGNGNIKGIILISGLELAQQLDVKRVTLPALNVCKTLAGQVKPAPLFIVTKGVRAVTEDELTCNPNPVTVLGMVRSLKNEHPNLFVRCLDCQVESAPEDIVSQLLYEVTTRKRLEEQYRVQVAYRHGVRYEPKLTKVFIQNSTEDLQLPTSSSRFQLVLPESKLIQDLRFDTFEEEKVGEDEIEVKVNTWSLNFKDVLTILKPSAEFEKLNKVGLDFAGVVTKVGPCSCFAVGDRVFGVNTKEVQLPSHVVLNSQSVLRIPGKMSNWEAVTLPTVFCTAYYCLVTLANMKTGDTVLIHTASGGVGLAAIQVANYVGARIITTAGNDRKRTFLRGLNLEHVFHSRDTSFEQEVLRVTSGKGVDIVLNSITGAGLKEASLRCCARNARFIEMSKLSIWAPEEVQLVRPDVLYKIVDLTLLKEHEWCHLLNKMNQLISENKLLPLPFVKFDALRIRQAFQYFQKAKHIGKVVCTMPDVVRHEGLYKICTPLFNGESTYLITGGLGGIGFEVFKWMLELGATDFVLLGRRPPKPEIAAHIENMNLKGLNVKTMFIDVGDYESCKMVVEQIQRNGKPLRGVMHCAGVLLDNPLPSQTWQSFEATFKSKVYGTWNLHNLTSHLPLEHFVMFSSVTALLGSPCQSNYVAANCFEDAFIHYRHSQGLPGTTINWGQWSNAGCATEFNLQGFLPVSLKRMLNGLVMSLRTSSRQISFCEFYSYEKASTLCCTFKNYLDEKHWREESSSSEIRSAGSGSGINSVTFWEAIDKSDTREDKMAVIVASLKVVLRTALRLQPDEPVQINANLQELGVDSLLMIELKNSIQNLVGSRLPLSGSFWSSCETLGQIAVALVDEIDQKGNDHTVVSSASQINDELYELLSNDCTLPTNVATSTNLLPACRPSEVKTVLVTGAAGQLGRHIIAHLITSYESVERVVCLLRKDSQTTSSFFIAQLKSLANQDVSRIMCFHGDVTMENLGLSLEDYAKLSRDVDAVIHCAAKTHLSEPYKKTASSSDDIRSVNVGGTLNLLKFASTHKAKHVYYPSLFGGAFLGRDGELCDDWLGVENIKSAVDGRVSGYYISKFVCEVLLKQANERNIPCKVFRFPYIGGDSKTGQLECSKNSYIGRYISFLRMGGMPSLPMPADIVPVDLCAEFSLKIFLNDEAPLEIFIIGHPSPQLEQQFVQLAKQEFGIQLDFMGWSEFLLKLEGMQDSKDAFLADVCIDVKIVSAFLADAWTMFPQWQDRISTFFKNAKVLKFIPNYEERIPASMEMVKNDLTYLKSNGQLNK